MNRLLTIVDSKYQRLEYLQSDGNQYINVNYNKIANHTYRFKGVVNFQDVTTRQLIGSQNFVFFGVVDGYIQIAQSEATHTDIQVSIDEDIDFDITFDLQNQTVNYIINGVSGSLSASMLTGGGFYLFSIGNNQFSCKCKLKSFLLYDNDVLVRKYVPTMIKSNNELGMLDLVEGKFYPNAGTGKFTANLDTMYAIIQGSPTVQDGRVSGFSDSNYLNLNQPFNPDTKKWEVNIRVITSSNIINDACIFRSAVSAPTAEGRYGILVSIGSKHFQLSVSFDGTSWAFGLTGTYTIITNTAYYVKAGWNGTTYYLQYSLDGINYTTDASTENNNSTYNGLTVSQIGIYSYSTVYHNEWKGTIDLNRSYIKIDDTKYKLQAVVGYSKVGTGVTITNGIASGFSSANYLKIAGTPFIENKKTEIKIKFTPNEIIPEYLLSFETRGGIYFKVASDKLCYGIVCSGSISNLSVGANAGISTLNNSYYIHFVFDGSTLNYKLGLSIDGNNVTWGINTTAIGIPNILYMDIGNRSNVNDVYFRGSIDLNKTYIKINNKLWFNGLEA